VPGFILGDSVYVRSTKKNGDNPAIYLHTDGKILFAAMGHLAKVRYRTSPWLFQVRGTELMIMPMLIRTSHSVIGESRHRSSKRANAHTVTLRPARGIRLLAQR
jgi:hypothetical protein